MPPWPSTPCSWYRPASSRLLRSITPQQRTHEEPRPKPSPRRTGVWAGLIIRLLSRRSVRGPGRRARCGGRTRRRASADSSARCVGCPCRGVERAGGRQGAVGRVALGVPSASWRPRPSKARPRSPTRGRHPRSPRRRTPARPLPPIAHAPYTRSISVRWRTSPRIVSVDGGAAVSVSCSAVSPDAFSPSVTVEPQPADQDVGLRSVPMVPAHASKRPPDHHGISRARHVGCAESVATAATTRNDSASSSVSSYRWARSSGSQ